jgi:hypothetical protein
MRFGVLCRGIIELIENARSGRLVGGVPKLADWVKRVALSIPATVGCDVGAAVLCEDSLIWLHSNRRRVALSLELSKRLSSCSQGFFDVPDGFFQPLGF